MSCQDEKGDGVVAAWVDQFEREREIVKGGAGVIEIGTRRGSV